MVWNPIRLATAGVLGAALLAVSGCQYDTGGGTTGGGAVTGLTTAPAGTTPVSRWVMPNLVGTVLQTAQDRIQALTHDGIFYTSSHDVSGRGRHQVLDRNWQVCSQNVPAGATITITTKIDFGVVKLTESCP